MINFSSNIIGYKTPLIATLTFPDVPTLPDVNAYPDATILFARNTDGDSVDLYQSLEYEGYHNWVQITGGGGVSQSWQSVLTVGSNITQNVTSDGNSHSFIFENYLNFQITSWNDDTQYADINWSQGNIDIGYRDIDTVYNLKLLFDNGNKQIFFIDQDELKQGLFIDQLQQIYQFGGIDLGGYYWEIDNNNNSIKLNIGETKYGMYFDVTNTKFSFGRYSNIPEGFEYNNYDGIYSACFIRTNGVNSIIACQSNKFEISEANLGNLEILIYGQAITTTSAGGNSGQHLKIKINNIPYKIALLNN